MPVTHHVMKTSNHTIPDQSPPRSTRTAPSAVHLDGGVKYATGASSKIRRRDNTTIGTWNTKTPRAAGMLVETGKVFVGPSAMMTQMRVLRLLEFATFNDLVLTNTFGHHKATRRWTWHCPNGQHHSQIDFILVRKRFRSGVNIARTRSFPGADIGSDHDLLMITFRLRLKQISEPKHTRLKFDLEELKDPNVLETFKAMIGGKFAPVTIKVSNEDTDIDSMITTFNTAATETASEILCKHRQEKKPWVTAEILDLCDKRR